MGMSLHLPFLHTSAFWHSSDFVHIWPMNPCLSGAGSPENRVPSLLLISSIPRPFVGAHAAVPSIGPRSCSRSGRTSSNLTPGQKSRPEVHVAVRGLPPLSCSKKPKCYEIAQPCAVDKRQILLFCSDKYCSVFIIAWELSLACFFSRRQYTICQ